MKVILLFIDGLGIGVNDPAINPIFAANTKAFNGVLENHRRISTDASLDIPGLPQSATGQTALFTGVNASTIIGHHLSGQPTETLVNIINKNNLFKELGRMGIGYTYANVYRTPYIDEIKNPSSRRTRPSVTSVMGMSVDFKFRNVDNYINGNGIYHDITGQILKESGYEVDIISPKQSAERLYKISRDYDFTLYEHFLTDIIGHKCDMGLAIKEIELLDSFLYELIKLIDLKEDLIIITSDHGNIEDASVKTHTMNKVPTYLIGKLPSDLGVEIKSILDITPFVIDVFKKARNEENIDD